MKVASHFMNKERLIWEVVVAKIAEGFYQIQRSVIRIYLVICKIL